MDENELAMVRKRTSNWQSKLTNVRSNWYEKECESVQYTVQSTAHTWSFGERLTTHHSHCANAGIYGTHTRAHTEQLDIVLGNTPSTKSNWLFSDCLNASLFLSVPTQFGLENKNDTKMRTIHWNLLQERMNSLSLPKLVDLNEMKLKLKSTSCDCSKVQQHRTNTRQMFFEESLTHRYLRTSD